MRSRTGRPTRQRPRGRLWALVGAAVGASLLVGVVLASTQPLLPAARETPTPTDRPTLPIVVQPSNATVPTLAPTPASGEDLRGAVPTGRGSFLPVRLGDLRLCPGSIGVAAYGQPGAGGRFYLPNHPAQPAADVAPTECWPTAEQALDAGYLAAPLPDGVEQIGRVYLAPPSEELAATCQDAADALGFTVPCPGLLPHVTRANPCSGRYRQVVGCVFEDQQAFVLTLPGVLPDPLASGLAIVALAGSSTHPLLNCPATTPPTTGGDAECPDDDPWNPGTEGTSPHAGSVLTRLQLDDGTQVAVSLDPSLGPVRVRVVDALQPVEPRG